MSIGIYKFENKLNHKIYIGQSTNIERRYQQHLYNKIAIQDKDGFDYALFKYGIENFTFEIVEQCNPEELDEKEIYWIAYFDSYFSGYNRTIGGKVLRGEAHPRSILTEEDVWMLREEYQNQVKRSKAFRPFLEKGVSYRCLLKVWNGETWSDIHMDVYTKENKEWHKHQTGANWEQNGKSSFERAIKQEEINQWLEDYQNGMNINAIAKKYQKDNGTIEKYLANPVAITEVKYRGRKIKNLETGNVFKSISSAAKWAGCGATTLTRHLCSDKCAGIVPGTREKAHWEEIL